MKGKRKGKKAAISVAFFLEKPFGDKETFEALEDFRKSNGQLSYTEAVKLILREYFEIAGK